MTAPPASRPSYVPDQSMAATTVAIRQVAPPLPAAPSALTARHALQPPQRLAAVHPRPAGW